MRISDLFRRLSYGELSNLAISGEGSGTLVEAKHPQIIQYTNEGLTRLFTRFNLRQNDVIIEQVAHITNYHLRKRFAESVAGDDGDPDNIAHPYIKDLAHEPFEEDVIRILEVHDSYGIERVLNDKGRPDSLFTPQPDLLQVPRPIDGQALSILYQARHPILRHEKIREDENLLQQRVDIPVYLEGALQAFVASQVYGHMNTQESTMKGQEYLSVCEAICLEVEDKDTVNQTFDTTHYKLSQRGFV
jgi:hypothetical protein